jgi:hypothetical protein
MISIDMIEKDWSGLDITRVDSNRQKWTIILNTTSSAVVVWLSFALALYFCPLLKSCAAKEDKFRCLLLFNLK